VQSFDDEFNIAHPVFQWIYRVTFNWSSVTDLLPGMRNHLRAVGLLRDRGIMSRQSRPSTSGTASVADDTNMDCDYSVLFREYFCVAAEELATSLDVPLAKLGVLYNGILTTGNLPNESRKQRRARMDLESGQKYPSLFGNGQLLFIVRTVDKLEASRLAADGYRFANPVHVCDIIGRTMKVSDEEVADTVERLRLFSQPKKSLTSSGSYLACFAIRANLKGSDRSWEILVPTDRPYDLPTVELSSGPLKVSQANRLSALDGLSVAECITYLNNISSDDNIVEEKDFVEHLLDQITELTHQVPEEFFGQSVFSCQPVAAPGLGHDRDESPPQLYAFSVIPDVHDSSVKSTVVTYIPLSFFQCIQRVYKNSPDHAILAQRIHREFAAILSHKDVQAYANRNSRAKKTGQRRTSRLSLPSKSLSNSPRDTGTPMPGHGRDNSIEQDSATIKSDHDGMSLHDDNRRSLAFGGIMVSSDTKVEVYDKDVGTDGESVEMSNLGVHSSVSIAAEAPTYVDELFRMASTRWRQR
jgi:hypothetical protein